MFIPYIIFLKITDGIFYFYLETSDMMVEKRRRIKLDL
jgi:hypothetical protein